MDCSLFVALSLAFTFKIPLASKEDVDRMKKDAELHASDDKKKRELIDARNAADALIYTAEKSLRDAGDKINENDKKAVNDAVENLKKIKDSSQNAEEIKKASEELSRALFKIGEAMYKQAGADANKKEEKAEGPKDVPHEDVDETKNNK